MNSSLKPRLGPWGESSARAVSCVKAMRQATREKHATRNRRMVIAPPSLTLWVSVLRNHAYRFSLSTRATDSERGFPESRSSYKSTSYRSQAMFVDGSDRLEGEVHGG